MTRRSNHRDRIIGLAETQDRSTVTAAHTTVADEIAILEKLLAEKRAANQNSRQLSEKRIVDDCGSATEEEPMFTWISPKPYVQHSRFRVWTKDLDGEKSYETFNTEIEALTFIEKAQSKLLTSGHPIEVVVREYLESRSREPEPPRASTLETLGFRLRAIIRDRPRFPIEAFPWRRAWDAHVAKKSTDTQYGVRSAIDGMIAWAVEQRILRRPPVLPSPTGHKARGKQTLRIDAARLFMRVALTEGDPLAIAAATMVLTGIRPGEAMTLRCRDLDNDGRLLWVASDGGKTAAAERQQEVPDELRPYLKRLAQNRSPDGWLFDFEPGRKRQTKNLYKSRRDALLRRVRAVCKTAGVPEVVSHSMRGLHAKLATESGVTSHVVAAALGHTSFVVTARHYVGAAATRRSAHRRSLEVLRNSEAAVTRDASEFTAAKNEAAAPEDGAAKSN